MAPCIAGAAILSPTHRDRILSLQQRDGVRPAGLAMRSAGRATWRGDIRIVRGVCVQFSNQ
jgi:hypothetical protein